MFGVLFLAMFMVPAGVLIWRIVVTKSRARWIRIGAAAAVMTTLVGAFLVYDQLTSFSFGNWRADVALAAALSGSIYLMLWSLRRRANRRHRTISLVAALIGLVPAVGAVASTIFVQE